MGVITTAGRRQHRTLNTIEELRSNKTAAVKGKSVYLDYFLIYSRILIKLVSPIFSQMNCGLFYAGVVSNFQL